MPNGTVVTFAALVFERHDLLVLALFENFRGYLCSRDDWISVSHVFSIGKQKYIAERRGFTGFDVEKIDIEGIPFRDAKLPATSSDDCVSHSFSGEKEPPTIPHPSRFGKRKAGSPNLAVAWLRCGLRRAAHDFPIQSFIPLRRCVPGTIPCYRAIHDFCS